MWRLLRTCARQGVDHWGMREVYKLAAREGLRPATSVSRAVRELEGQRVLMIVDDEVHWLEEPQVFASEVYTLVGAKRIRGEGSSAEGGDWDESAAGSDLRTTETDNADMLSSGAPLRVGPGDLGAERLLRGVGTTIVTEHNTGMKV